MSQSNIVSQARWAHVLAGLLLAGAGIAGVYLAGATPSIGVILFYAVLGLAVAIVPVLIVSRNVGKPIEQLREVISSTRSDGDLSRRAEVDSGSSIAATAQAYNELISSFQGISTRIVFNSEQV